MRTTAGFTLLELLIVIGVLSVLMGLSLGYIGKTDVSAVANSILAGELRAAQLTARAEGVPTEVLLRPGREGEASTVQSRLLQPVVSFHFEPRSPVLDESLRPTIGGDDVPSGRFGHARRPRAGDRTPVLRWTPPQSALDLRDGFVVRLDVMLDRREQATVLRYLPALELTLDAEARPRARVRMHGQGGVGTMTATVTSQIGLPVARWCTLDVGCDGRMLWLTLDGREIATAPAEGTPQQDADAVFEVAPGDAAIPGACDEVRWFVYGFASPQNLPREIVLPRELRFRFDARGEATEQPVVNFSLPEVSK
jgi:prepilin-type N-terminal cleavage/methylation domain-containing protein